MKIPDCKILIYHYVSVFSELIYAIFAVIYLYIVCVSEHDSVYTVHSIELEFCLYVTDYRRVNSFDFVNVGCIFLLEYKNEFLHL